MFVPPPNRPPLTALISILMGALAVIVSLLGCLFYLFSLVGLLCAIFGAVAGHVAWADVRKSGVTDGKGIALAGMILSYVMAGFNLILLVFFLTMMMLFGTVGFSPGSVLKWVGERIDQDARSRDSGEDLPVTPPQHAPTPVAPSRPSEPAPDAVTAQEVPDPSGKGIAPMPERLISKYLMIFPKAKPLVLTPEETESNLKALVWMEDGKIVLQADGSADVTQTTVEDLNDKGKRSILRGLKRMFGKDEPEKTQFQDAIKSLEPPPPPQ